MTGPTSDTVRSSDTVPSSVLVVGGGLGGYHAAHALRRRGFTGELSVLGAETHPTYDRPPLSKAFLAGTLTEGDLALDDADSPLDVTWWRGEAATRLTYDGDRPGVTTATGRELCADAVVLATGAEPIRIGPPAPGSHVLRTLDDARGLREQGMAGRDVVVVGTGFIGLEAASTAVALGAASVTVVSPEPAPLVERFGSIVAETVQRLHERRGVRFRCGVWVTGVETDGRGHAAGVRLDDGELVAGQVVMVGVGVRPATGWLRDGTTGLVLDRGGAVLCSPTGRTDAPGVWAVGDCASWAREGGLTPRGGHWQDALDHAGIAAADLLGQEPAAQPTPYCWSDQHDVRLQFAGHLDGRETAVVRDGTVDGADLLVVWEYDSQETAVLGMDRPRDVTRWRRTRAPRPAVAV